MTIRSTAAAIGAAFILTSAAALAAVPAKQAGPIRIVSVNISPTRFYGDLFVQGFVKVGFINQRSVTATHVIFDTYTPSGAFLERIDDVGTFSPGVKIYHQFYNHHSARHPQIKVTKVFFADGTTWRSKPPKAQATYPI